MTLNFVNPPAISLSQAPLPERLSDPFVALVAFEAGVDKAILVESAFFKALSAQTQARLLKIHHPKRFEQSFWGRLLSFYLSQHFGLHLKEEPPYSPKLLSSTGEEVAFLSIAHTDHHVAVAIDTRPIALDIEGIRPFKDIDGMLKMALPRAIVDWAKKQTIEENLPLFFSLWGIKECQIKLNNHLRRVDFVLSEKDIPSLVDDVNHLTFKVDVARPWAREYPKILLTVASERQCPLIIREIEPHFLLEHFA